ncbi:MAG: hypothetical protein WB947_07330 [Thermoplasmata archaeon]
MTTIVRPLAFSLLALPFAWATAVVLSDFSRAAFPVVVIAWAVCATFSVAATLRPQYLEAWGIGVLAVLVAAAALTSLVGSVGPELGAGILLGVPWILVGYVARPASSLGLRFVAYGIGATAGLILLTTPLEVAAGSGGMSGVSFLRGVFTVIADQSQVLGGLVPGSAVPTLPLHNFFDPVYAGLTAASILGLLLVTVRPQTGPGAPLPLAIRLRREGPEARTLPLAYGFSGAQQAIFFERSSAEPPLTAWPPGLVSVLAGAVGASLFLTVAYLYPLSALLVVSGALGAVSVVVVIVTERPGLLRAPVRHKRRRALFGGPPTPRVTRELLTSPSLPVPEGTTTPSDPRAP